MQASQATNEPRLPRQVLKRSAEVQALLDARRTASEPETPPTEGTPSAALPPSADPVPPAAVPREQDPAYWKHRFEVTSGLLRREREERAADAERFLQQTTELQGQIQTLRTSQSSDKAIDLTAFLTQEQIENLGEDESRAIVSTAIKAAQATVMQAMEAEIQPLKARQANDEERRKRDARDRFLDALIELVPDYDVIDKSEGFEAWLAEADPASGLERQVLLTKYVQKGDAAKVAKLFKDYKASEAPLPIPPATPAGTGAAPQGEVRPASALTAPTNQEIREFFKRAALGQVKDAERTQFEARLKLLGPR